MTQTRETIEKTFEAPEGAKAQAHQPAEFDWQHSFLQLQRKAGNRAVVNLLATRGLVQRKCATCSGTTKCAACEEEEERLQRKPKDVSGLSATSPRVQRLPDLIPADTAAEPTPSATGPLIVEDDASAGPNQMRKSEFLEQLRSTVCTTADTALAEAGMSTAGCPYIEKWLSYYSEQTPAHIERALRKYAPEANSATTAADYIPAISNRVREGVQRWAETGDVGDVPDELRDMLPGGGGVLGALAGIGSAIGGAISAVGSAIGSAFSALFKRKPGAEEDDEQQTQPELRAGQPLDAGAQSRMREVFGHDFSNVRVHTDAHAAGLSNQLNARAFTIGSDIAFGAGEYQPGTMIGDALLAHELAHVVQQGGGAPQTTLHKGEVSSDESLEEEADVSAVGAVSSLWFGARGAIADIGKQAAPQLRSGLRLQRCNKTPKAPDNLLEGPILEAVNLLAQSDQEVDRNTARQIREDRVHVYYIEDLKQPADIDSILTKAGYDPALYTVYLHPVSGANMFVQKNALGFRPLAYPTDIFGFRSLDIERWKSLLVHETSHAVNPVPSTPLETFKEEFRAYWVAEYRDVADLDERARQIREHILRDYPEIKSAYDSDPKVQAAIDAYNRPEGDLTNVTGLTQHPMTHTEMVVERAKKLIPIYEKYIEEWNERGVRRMDEKETRDKMLASRKSIEDEIAAKEGRPEMEATRMAELNRKPLKIEVTKDKVVFRVKFQVKFLGTPKEGDAAKLRAAIARAASEGWTKDADRVMEGKRFELIPEITEVATNAPRDQNYWLIEVRGTDTEPVTHPGCKFDQPGVPAGVTDSMCDGGVMSLPPKSIGDSDLISHEMHHLFGFVDRYVMTVYMKPNNKDVDRVETIPMRSMSRRRDPLGGENAPIIDEDLAFLFENLGVYDLEANRGLETLRRLEDAGMDIGTVQRRLEKQKEIVKCNCEPDSLIPIRTNFNDQMIKNAENL
jgi:hypothetical protein